MSEVVDFYIKISRKSPKAGRGTYIVILETITASGKPGTLTLKKELDEVTPHRLELQAIHDAIHRIKRHVTINIHSDHGWFKTVRERGWFDKWHDNDWIVNGRLTPGADLYQEIYMMELVGGIQFGGMDEDLGSYKTYLESEIKNASPIL